MITSDVTAWALRAEPGERVTYYVGFYAGDLRSNLGGDLAVGKTINSAWRASSEGLVFLAQRRVTPGKDGRSRFSYEATRISAYTARLLGLLQEARPLAAGA